MKLREAKLLQDDPAVAEALNNLAQLLKGHQPPYKGRAPHAPGAQEWIEKSFGPEHPNVAIDLNDLAGLLTGTNRLEAAEHLCRRMVGIFLDFTRPPVTRIRTSTRP